MDWLTKWEEDEITKRTAGRRAQIARAEEGIRKTVADIRAKADELATDFKVKRDDKKRFPELLKLAAGTFGVVEKMEPATLPGQGEDDEAGRLGDESQEAG